MKRIVLMMFGLCLTMGMIGCKKEEAPVKPAETPAAAPAETPAEPAK